MSSTINTRRVAKNTILLYVRLLFVMLIGLYTVRAFLGILGVTDYGIYNVVGSIVSLGSFITGTLASASNRYFSIEIGRNDFVALKKCFSLNFTVFGGIMLLLLILAETLGLWYVNNVMVIPPDRLYAANVVYQLSIVSFVFSFVVVPYNALILAHEKMTVYAYIGIVQAIAKLVAVFILQALPYDKLVLYGVLMLCTSLISSLSYIIYCLKNFKESHFSFCWDKAYVKELFGYSSYNLIGTLSMVVRSQGINLLINAFFNPVVNAARAIAFQVESVTMNFASNFFSAIRPQMYKAYSNKEYDGLIRLSNMSAVFSAYLLSVLSFPLIFNIDYILRIWLVQVPDYATIFTVLILIDGLVGVVSNPMYVIAAATGNLKNFQLVTSLVMVSNLPISYIALKCGASPISTCIVSIAITSFAVWERAYMAKKVFKELTLSSYFAIIMRLLFASVTTCVITFFITPFIGEGLIKLIASTILIFSILSFMYYFVVMDKIERRSVKNIIKTTLSNVKTKIK